MLALQLFHTGDVHKGWGVRAKEPIPKGAFVFEYIGEILTNKEMSERNEARKGLQFFAVALDADSLCEREVNDDSGLLLDATYIGNIARYLNHR